MPDLDITSLECGGGATVAEDDSAVLDGSHMDVDIAAGELSDNLPVVQRLLAVRGCVLRMGIKGLAAYNAGKFVLSAALGWKAAKFLTELGLDQIDSIVKGSEFFETLHFAEGMNYVRGFLTYMATSQEQNEIPYRVLAGFLMVITSASFWVMLGSLGVRRFYKREIAPVEPADAE